MNYLKATSDRIYYDIAINTNKISEKNAYALDTRADPIIDIPEQYTLSILRATIPSLYIPIFIFPYVWSSNIYNPTGPNTTVYSVTLSYAGNDYRSYINYVSQTSNYSITNPEYYYIFSIQWFVDLINTAFLDAFTALKTANPLAPITQAPYIIYDNVNYLFTIIVQKQYVGNVQMYMNTALFNFFETFNAKYNSLNSVNGKDIEILLYDNGSNNYESIGSHVLATLTDSSYTITSTGLFTTAMDGNLIAGFGISANIYFTYVNANTGTLSNPATLTALTVKINTTNASPTVTSAGLFTPNMTGAVITGTGIPNGTTFTYVNANTGTLSANATSTLLIIATINILTSSVIVSFTNNNLLRIQQDFQTTQLWSDLDSIVITTTSIPVKEEFMPLANSTTGSLDYGNNISFINILTDFEPDLKLAYEQRAIYQYVPQAEFRRVELRGTIPLNKLDIAVYWKDLRGVLHPLTLGPYGQGVNIKIMFEKKDIYKQKPKL